MAYLRRATSGCTPARRTDERLQATPRAIPETAPLSTWTKILPHVSHRRVLHRFPSLGPDDGALAEFVLTDARLLPRTDVAAATGALAVLPALGDEKILDEDGIKLWSRKREVQGSAVRASGGETFTGASRVRSYRK